MAAESSFVPAAPPQSPSIDINDLVSLKVACRTFPELRCSGRDGRPPDFTSVLRWHLHGRLDAGDARHKLRAVRGPAGLMTTRRWVIEFLEQLNGGSITDPTGNAPRSPAARRREFARAAAELSLDGI